MHMYLHLDLYKVSSQAVHSDGQRHFVFVSHFEIL